MVETMAHVTAVASQKGGTGKTVVAAALGALLALAGQRTLLVDLDQQSDLTAMFGHNAETLDFSIVDVLVPVNPVPAETAVIRSVHGVSGLDLLPSDIRAAALEKQIVSEVGRERLVRRALKPLQSSYDRIIIDCPPSLGDMTINGLCASDDVIAPVSMEDKNAVQGAVNLLETLHKLREQDQMVTLKTLVRVKADSKRQAHRALADLARLGLPVAKTDLRARADWNNAGVEGMPVVLWGPRTDAARDARDLAAELWPEVRFPYASEIRTILKQQRAATAVTEVNRAAA
jgi:chromosome partitioning protein